MSDAAAGGVILLKDSKTPRPIKISVEHALTKRRFWAQRHHSPRAGNIPMILSGRFVTSK